jgi:pyruvate/2-oxoglutarate dehydrogenase complex dihydrolipoamide acyltransferase (E2) component
MIVELKMPKFGSMMTAGTVTEWYKKEGDTVKKGEHALGISTEKLNNDVDSTENGVVKTIVANVGDKIPVGGVLALIETTE